MSQLSADSKPPGHALILTAWRRCGRYLIVLAGRELLVTFTLYNLLVDLLLAKRDPNGAGYAAAHQCANVTRVAVCRLRHAIDALLGAGAGRTWIATGAGEEYSIEVALEDVALDPGLAELVPLGVLMPAQLEELRGLIETMPERYQPREEHGTRYRRDALSIHADLPVLVRRRSRAATAVAG